jgi:hypothetical protein
VPLRFHVGDVVEGAIDYSATKKRSSPYSPKRKNKATPATKQLPATKLEPPPKTETPQQSLKPPAAQPAKIEANEDASPKPTQRTLWD